MGASQHDQPGELERARPSRYAVATITWMSSVTSRWVLSLIVPLGVVALVAPGIYVHADRGDGLACPDKVGEAVEEAHVEFDTEGCGYVAGAFAAGVLTLGIAALGGIAVGWHLSAPRGAVGRHAPWAVAVPIVAVALIQVVVMRAIGVPSDESLVEPLRVTLIAALSSAALAPAAVLMSLSAIATFRRAAHGAPLSLSAG